MKNAVALLSFFILVFGYNISNAQTTMEYYFKYKGVAGLSSTAHPSNDFIDGTYDVQSQYVDILIRSRDGFNGRVHETKLLVSRGFLGLHFTDIYVVSDTDTSFYRAFEFFGKTMKATADILKSLNKEQFEEMRTVIINLFGSDINQWTGNTWALIALNLDYFEYQK
jgi:hypothetical protein